MRATGTDSMAEIFAALVGAEGSRAHRWCGSPELMTGRNATRNLADVIHHLCMLHGRHPGVMDYAAAHTANDAAHAWLTQAVDGFAQERAYLAGIVVAAGPLPSTPGQADCEAALQGQRHALDMLAQSDRTGCALGAAIALVLDWSAIRTVLDAAAERLGVDIAPNGLPGEQETLTLAMAAAETMAIERALCFGAQQLLAQQRGLWDMLEARHAARTHG